MDVRTPNWFFTSTRFLSGAVWKERGAGFVVWPSLWVEPGLEPSLDVRVTRWTLGWARWRAQCDVGVWCPLQVDGPIDWERLGVDDFLTWARRTFTRRWGRADVDRLFRQEPSWRRLAVLGTTRNHYVRVLLARAMLAAPDAPLVATLGSPGGLAEHDGRSTSTSQKAWTEATVSETAAQSLMHDLEKLGANLRRGDDDTET